MTDFDKINRMTFFEYRIRSKAAGLMRIDKQEDIALQAWQNFVVRSVRKNGSPRYRKFKDFFNKQELINDMDGAKPEPSSLAKRYMEYMKKNERIV